jgi:hypothetical protein
LTSFSEYINVVKVSEEIAFVTFTIFMKIRNKKCEIKVVDAKYGPHFKAFLKPH